MSSGCVKRVISNPDEVGRNFAKMTKPSSQTTIDQDQITPAMGSLAIVYDTKEGHESPQSALADVNTNIVFNEGIEKKHITKQNNEEEEEKRDELAFPRHVSVDSSAPPHVIEVTRQSSSTTSSVIGNKSDSTVGSSAGNAANNWGWFEDIHDHSSKGKKSPSDKKDHKNKKKGDFLRFTELVNPLTDVMPKKNHSGKKILFET